MVGVCARWWLVRVRWIWLGVEELAGDRLRVTIRSHTSRPLCEGCGGGCQGRCSPSALKVLYEVNTITAYAKEMSDFVSESEPTERRAFIKSFVKEIVVIPGNALLRYIIPIPGDSRIPGRNAEDMALDGSVLTNKR